jgi:hypothetical protein
MKNNYCIKILVINTIANLVILASPSFAAEGFQYTSLDRKLNIKFGGTCSTVKPSGSYRFRNETSGVLTAVDCNNIGGDAAFSKFIDTTGKQRCQGRMNQFWGGSKGIVTVWKATSAVKGYRCSKVGQTIEITMDGGKRW